jgi:hypothetical protein
MRSRVKLMALLCATCVSLGVVPGVADEPKPKESPKEQPKEEPKSPPDKWRRVVHAIEVSISKREPFGGRLVLRMAAKDSQEPMLSYWWGGKCKGTEMTASRMALVVEAMKNGWAVEVPGFPIKHEDSIYMCMSSIRVLAD